LLRFTEIYKKQIIHHHINSSIVPNLLQMNDCLCSSFGLACPKTSAFQPLPFTIAFMSAVLLATVAFQNWLLILLTKWISYFGFKWSKNMASKTSMLRTSNGSSLARQCQKCNENGSDVNILGEMVMIYWSEMHMLGTYAQQRYKSLHRETTVQERVWWVFGKSEEWAWS